jgi:hypothetical protein
MSRRTIDAKPVEAYWQAASEEMALKDLPAVTTKSADEKKRASMDALFDFTAKR